MEEQLYKMIGRTGGWNITIGIMILVVGITSGILLIVSGGKLLAQRSKILF